MRTSHPYYRKRIYVTRQKIDYYTVYIFRDKETMRNYWANQVAGGFVQHSGRNPRQPDFEAQATWWRGFKVTGEKEIRDLPNTGQVIFHVAFLGAGIVAHEFAHAAHFYWLHRLGKRWRPYSVKHDEQLADSVGYMVMQFWTWFWKMEKKFKRWGKLCPRG